MMKQVRGLTLMAMLALGVALSGCSGKDIPDGWVSLIEAEQVARPKSPAECFPKRDPKWRSPPNGDEPMDATARRERGNKNAFHEIEDSRRVCAAALAKIDSAPGPPAASAKQ